MYQFNDVRQFVLAESGAGGKKKGGKKGGKKKAAKRKK